MKQQDTVFMVMPFGDDLAATAYTYITKPVAESFGMKIIRADEIFGTNPIFNDIVTAIQQAAIVIVDISGSNANCFYELGMAHTLKQTQTIMITHNHFDDTPFDIAHFRIIKYEDSIKGRQQYEENLRKTIQSILTGVGELYNNEFSVASTALRSSGQSNAIYFGIALAKTAGTVSIGNALNIEGSFKETGASSSHHVSNSSSAQPLLDLGYASVAGGTITLTEKGRAFANFLLTQGYICYIFNGERFTDETYFEKMEKQRKAAQPNLTDEKVLIGDVRAQFTSP